MKTQNGNLRLGELIASMEINLSKAKYAWYTSSCPHDEVLTFVEVINALSKNAIEKIKGND